MQIWKCDKCKVESDKPIPKTDVGDLCNECYDDYSRVLDQLDEIKRKALEAFTEKK